MDTEPQRELTLILGRARDGDDRARGELVALVYDELRRVATRLMRRERADHTLSPTAVVHEAVIRLLGEAVFDKAADQSFLFAAAGAGGASHSMRWWTISRGRGWTSSRSTRPSTGWPS